MDIIPLIHENIPFNHKKQSHWISSLTTMIPSGWWLNPTPLKNMTSSIGMMIFPTEWENKIHVPNH